MLVFFPKDRDSLCRAHACTQRSLTHLSARIGRRAAFAKEPVPVKLAPVKLDFALFLSVVVVGDARH
jgi:hypothetical protein